MDTLKNALDIVMRNLASKKEGPADAGPEQWLKNILTKKELRHIKVKYFSKGVLGVIVDSSAWLYILSLKKEELLEKLHKENAGVKNVVFRIGEL